MHKLKLIHHALIVALFTILGANPAGAASPAQAKQEAQTGTESSEQIYGSQLMTREERAEHRAKMRSLKTREEREAYRIEHHKKMQERAMKMGKTIPDTPRGAGPQSGPRGGMPSAEPAGGGY